MRTFIHIAVLLAVASPAAAQITVTRTLPGDSLRVFMRQRVTAEEVRTMHAQLRALLSDIQRREVQLRVVADSTRLATRREEMLERLISGQYLLNRLYSELYPMQSQLSLACSMLRSNATGRDGYLGVTFGSTMKVETPPAGGGVSVMTWTQVPARVEWVEPGSPAEKAGVRLGDELIQMGGRPVEQLGDLELDQLLRPGVSLVLRLRSAGRERDVNVTVGKSPEFPVRECQATGGFAIAAPLASVLSERAASSAAPPSSFQRLPARAATIAPIPQIVLSSGMRVAAYGATFRTLDPDARDVVKVEGDGVFVDHVSPGTPAHTAGLRSFDVVTRVNGRPVRSPLDMRVVSDDERTLVLTVVRGGETRTVTLVRQ